LARADALDDGVRRIGLQLQCPVCQGKNVADSPSGLATDMRSVMRTKLSAGESDQQIRECGIRVGSVELEPQRRASAGINLGSARL
jgi:cytochrome c-type biogenesis protein CcmH